MAYDIHNRYFWWMVCKIWPSELLKERLKKSHYDYKFDWILDMENSPDLSDEQYYILDEMNRIIFRTAYNVSLDENRIDDARIMRSDFIRERGLPEALKVKYLDINPVSVMEVLVALSLRCDRDIEGDPDNLYLTAPLWFWTMVNNLKFWTDSCKNEAEIRCSVDYKCDIFMDRKYSYYGEGGPFFVENPLKSMKKTDLWMQLNWYLTENFGTNSVI